MSSTLNHPQPQAYQWISTNDGIPPRMETWADCSELVLVSDGGDCCIGRYYYPDKSNPTSPKGWFGEMPTTMVRPVQLQSIQFWMPLPPTMDSIGTAYDIDQSGDCVLAERLNPTTLEVSEVLYFGHGKFNDESAQFKQITRTSSHQYEARIYPGSQLMFECEVFDDLSIAMNRLGIPANIPWKRCVQDYVSGNTFTLVSNIEPKARCVALTHEDSEGINGHTDAHELFQLALGGQLRQDLGYYFLSDDNEFHPDCVVRGSYSNSQWLLNIIRLESRHDECVKELSSLPEQQVLTFEDPADFIAAGVAAAEHYTQLVSLDKPFEFEPIGLSEIVAKP